MVETVVESAQTVVPSVIPEVKTVQAPEPDLMTKVSQFKRETSKEEIFNVKDIDKITDPAAKEYVEKLSKSLQGDYTRKTQELAEQRKLLEQAKKWTPERIQQELLSNTEFLEAAQQINATQNPPNSGLTDEQFSALTDKEKAEMASLKSEVIQLKQTNQQTAIRAEITQKDAQLQAKFSDYNPVEIDAATQRLASMNLSDIREYVYKATMHEAHVQAAYEMGKKDGRGITENKIGGFSTNGSSTVGSNGVPTKEKGENDKEFFVRLAKHRLEESRRK